MIARTIAQAIYQEGRPLARSDDFDETWQSEVERIVAGFGLPAGESLPECLFVVPFARRRVAVVTVSGRRFRFVILSRALYEAIPDPFAIVERFPFGPELANSLPTLAWPEEPLPRRTAAQLDSIFKLGDGPLLLGACQTLVDSGRIVLKRDAPDSAFCRDLWNLLPDSIRRQTWLATFAYSTDLGFNLVAMPSIPENGIVGYLTEDQARDYPESRYERELQAAVEHNDQRTVDRLLSRRSSSETLRMAMWMVLAAVVFSLAMRLLGV
jgi:hypothetical protein